MIIYKYPLGIGSPNYITVPKDAKVVRFGMQGGVPTIWVLQNLDIIIKITHVYEIYGTGMEVNNNNAYIASCEDGVFIWHLFRV
jgi:hypothetical protein